MIETTSLAELVYEYQVIKQKVPSYRLGQHFINTCIKESSSDFYCKLWNEEDEVEALKIIGDVAADYCWFLWKLPKIDRGAIYYSNGSNQ